MTDAANYQEVVAAIFAKNIHKHARTCVRFKQLALSSRWQTGSSFSTSGYYQRSRRSALGLHPYVDGTLAGHYNCYNRALQMLAFVDHGSQLGAHRVTESLYLVVRVTRPPPKKVYVRNSVCTPTAFSSVNTSVKKLGSALILNMEPLQQDNGDII